MATYCRYKLIILIMVLGFIACKKENIPPAASKNDYISNRTVRYTLLVVPAGNTGFKSVPQGVDSAFVSLVMNDSIYTRITDKNGLVTFNNLAAGNAAVTIRYANHCTANLIVDLGAKSDTLNDENNIRNASTMVALFPYAGKGTATISGRTFADMDLTTAEPEIAPAGLQISSIIEPDQFIDFVKQSGDGQIISISYEQTINRTITDIHSDFSFSIPASGSGLKIILTADDFVFNQLTSPGIYQRKIFRPVSDTIVAFSGFNYISDIKFE